VGLVINSFLILSDESTTASINGARCAAKDVFPTPGKPQTMTINTYTAPYVGLYSNEAYYLLLDGVGLMFILCNHMIIHLPAKYFYQFVYFIPTSTKLYNKYRMN
jgi:hypothetical protein